MKTKKQVLSRIKSYKSVIEQIRDMKNNSDINDANKTIREYEIKINMLEWLLD